MRGWTIAIKWASVSVTNRQKSLATWKRDPNLYIKDRSGITHLCNVSDWPTDTRKKKDIPNIRW